VKGCYYFVRDILFIVVLYNLATRIEVLVNSIPSLLSSTALAPNTQRALVVVIKWIAWCLYFHWQGIAFAGLWCLGHEAGHGTLSTYSWLNTLFGFILHTVSVNASHLDPEVDINIELQVPFDSLFFMAFNASCSPCESSLLLIRVPVIASWTGCRPVRW